MKPLKLSEVNEIGAAVASKLPVKAVVKWVYKPNKKSHLLTFKIKD